jgi:UDP-N-acetylmuramate--alanine ligase
LKSIVNIQTFYFVGIGGIGMSALARYFKFMGKDVFGYDKAPSEVTRALISEGIPVGFVDEVAELPGLVSKGEDVLVVYTPAISKQNMLLQYFISEGFPIMKRAALLAEVTKNSNCLAVAGTHGKTTTSAILGHLLVECNMPVTAFLGGIAENYNSNFICKGH